MLLPLRWSLYQTGAQPQQNSGGWFIPHYKKKPEITEDEEELFLEKQRQAEEEIRLLEVERKNRLKIVAKKFEVRQLEISILEIKSQLDELKVLNALIQEQRQEELAQEEEEIIFLMIKLIA